VKKFTAFIAMFLFIFNFSLEAANAEEILSWADCVKEAARNHPDLISAKEIINQSEAGKKITASTLFPQVDGSVSAATSKTSGAVKRDTYSYGVSGSQLLFDGNKTINSVKAASEDIKISQYNYKFTSAEVRFRLRAAFVSLLKAQEELSITQQIYDIRRSNLELITLRYQSGMEHRGALLLAEANLGDASFGIIQAKRDVEVAQRSLIKEMGRNQFSPVNAKGDFVVKNTEKEKPDFDSIVKTNPSLQSLITKINQSNLNLRAAYDNFFPQLSAQAGAGRTDNRWPPQTNEWNAGLALTFPIFEGGLRFAQLSQAQSVLNQAKSDERSGRDALVLTLEQTWATLQDSIDNVSVQKKFLEAAEERARIAEAQYSTGFITYDNWIIIEDNLVSSKKSLLDAQANALAAKANWILAKGETLEYED
jgi:outer membrane protein TolC